MIEIITKILDIILGFIIGYSIAIIYCNYKMTEYIDKIDNLLTQLKNEE
jgi:hypothetical protein